MTTETRSGTKYVEQGNKPSNVKSTVLDPTTALTVKTMFTSPSEYDARVHRSDVDDVQLELPQICPSCTAAVGVRCPVAPKFNPESEIIWPPDEATFESVLLTTGPSKLKSLRLVPTRDDPTARTRAADADFGITVLQATVVADVHADVLHAPSESNTLALGSHTPKLSPVTVTELPPLEAELSCPYDATAASKLYTALAVPATPPTLTADTPYVVLTPLLKHPSVVADVHLDVLHTTISSAPVALRSTEPKLSPTTVTELPPLTAECSHVQPYKGVMRGQAGSSANLIQTCCTRVLQCSELMVLSFGRVDMISKIQA